MTALELYKVLELAIQNGHGNALILFDTEARKFDYHMAKVGSAYLETNFDPENPFIWLGEARQ